MHDAILLIITAGLSDLQPLVITSDGTRKRAHLRRGTRKLHEKLADGTLPWHIDTDLGLERLPEIKLDAPHFDLDAPHFDLKAPIWLNAEQEDYVVYDYDRNEQGALIFVAPKLVKVWKRLAAEPGRLQGTLILATDRAADSPHGRDEPIALGTVLSQWFQQLPGAHTSTIETYLRGQETLEGAGIGPVAPEIAERIEKAIRRQVAELPNAAVWLANGGGLPQIKDVVAAAARLFARQVENAYRTENGAEGVVTLTPSDALRARRVALHYVRRGGFVEAHTAAFEFHDDPAAQRWVKPLAHVARLFNQNPTDDLGVADHTVPHSLAVIAKHGNIRCLLPALRTEAAIRAERWLEAMNWTITFHDAAFLDFIAALPGVTLFDRCRQIEFGTPPPDQRLINSDCLTWSEALRGNRIRYRYDALGRLTDIWADVINKSSLYSLHKAVSDGAAVRNLRNTNTHNTLNNDEIEAAKTLFVARGLWNLDAPTFGGAFIGRPLISDVLRDLLPEHTEPTSLYRELVCDLVARLIDPTAVINGARRAQRPPVPLGE